MWTTIAAERGALADDLVGMSDAEWNARSLCADWTVQDALAHMASTAAMTPPRFVGGFIAAGFSFPKFSASGIAKYSGGSPTETLQAFRNLQNSTSSPPGPKTSWLGETIVHSEDIRRPLGIRHDYPTDAVKSVLDFYKGSNTLIGTKERIAGLTLKASDTDWTHGSGPTVEGPVLSLLMAATGRRAGCDDLTGDGVDTLRSRTS
ncbi:MAG: hypothetical protein JWR85_2594 [Marmoricola sp.]|nr:hypothetical protein [Marmoricola sp.]